MPRKAKANEQPCPACKEPCAYDAIICPNCRTPFSPDQISARKDLHKSTTKAATVGCLGLIGIVLLIGMCSKSSDDGKSATDKKPAAVVATGDAKKDAITVYKAMLAATSGCDAASSLLAESLQGGDLVRAYRVADRAESACLGTPSEIRAIDIPDSISGENRSTTEKSLEACNNAYLSKWDAAKKFKSVIDGDASPSALAALQETTEGIQAGQMACVAGLMSVATSLGATSADLGIDDSK